MTRIGNFSISMAQNHKKPLTQHASFICGLIIRLWTVAIVCIEFVLLSQPLDKSGVKPSVLSLPSGPGSIEGLGKAFQPQLNTGTATYQVAFDLPPGTAGFAPEVSLDYNSGSGNSIVGLGWTLSGTLSIERQTEKGFPRYRDQDQGMLMRDVFIFQNEELVPLTDGTYRCENETQFRRFMPFQSEGEALDSWLVEDRDGTKHWLGRYVSDDSNEPNSRIIHPSPPIDGLGERSPFVKTYIWLEDAAEDVNGNRIEYEYVAFDDSPGVLYLEEIRYYAKSNSSNYHRVQFFYESRPDRYSDNRSGFYRATGRRCREISISSVFQSVSHPVRSYVLSYDPSDGALGNLDAESPQTQQRLNLGQTLLHSLTQYDSSRTPGGNGDSGTPLPPMRFAYSGYYLTEPHESTVNPLLPLTFRLRLHESNPLVQGLQTGQLFQNTDEETLSAFFDLQLESSSVQFADMNGDGLPDLLNTKTDQNNPLFRVAFNLGNGIFEESVPVTESPVLLDLAQHSDQNSVSLADVDGDGMTDMVQILNVGNGSRTRIHPNRYDPSMAFGPTGFQGAPSTDASTPLELFFSSPRVRQMDVDFDKRIDLLSCNSDGLNVFRANESGGWTDLGRQDWSQSPNDGRLPKDYCFYIEDGVGNEISDQRVQLIDMNGDRLLDLVRMIIPQDGQATVHYRPLIAPLQWGEEVTVSFADLEGKSIDSTAKLNLPNLLADPFHPQNNWNALQWMDANGDGLTDLVYVQQNRSLLIYFNCHGVALQGPYDQAGVPAYQPYDLFNPTILRSLDVNGNGSTDLVFYHASGENDLAGFRYLDFIGGQKPGLLQVIDNGIGRRTFIRYKSAIEDRVRANQNGHPWLTTMPHPVWVVAGIVDDIGLDLNGDGESDRYATSLDYRDGYYDGFEKQFRGFAYVQKIEWGDDVDESTGLPSGVRLGQASAPTGVTRHRFMTGSPDQSDNDQYIEGVDTDSRPVDSTIDETTFLGGREEESLKGKPVWVETVDGSALLDETADFDLCSHGTAVAALSGDPYGDAASRSTPDKYIYTRTHSRWALRRLYRPLGSTAPRGRLLRKEPDTVAETGKSVTFPVLIAASTETVEANQLFRENFSIANAPFAEAPPATTRTTMDYDEFGNTILESDEGIVSGVQPPPDDERVVKRSFIIQRNTFGTVEPWIIDRQSVERMEDEKGNFVNETRNYYDGSDFLGFPLGQLGSQGLISRIQRRVSDPASPAPEFEQKPSSAVLLDSLKIPGDPRSDPTEWITIERRKYDKYGNITWILDPLGRVNEGAADITKGHARELVYDSMFHTFPTEEHVHVGNGRSKLFMMAQYTRGATDHHPETHWGFGVMIRSIDFNGNATDYFYDSFARLTAIVRPGDSESLPTQIFDYRPADPHRGLIYDYDRSGKLSNNGNPISGAVHSVASAVQTDVRENADAAGVVTTMSYTDGAGKKLISMEEDSNPGVFNVTEAVRYNLRGQPWLRFQPYATGGSEFELPELDQDRVDLFADSTGRVIRTLLPPELESDPSDRRETRNHYLPYQQFLFDEEDLTVQDASSSHLQTPMVHFSDGLGRLIGVDETVRDAGDGMENNALQSWPTRYSYDLNDNLVHILDSQGNQKWFRYDGLGRKIFMNDPDRGIMVYSYDEASNLLQTLDAKNQQITYTYDGVNRLLTEDYHDEGQTISHNYSYNPNLPLTRSNRPDVAFFYDTAITDLPQGDNTIATANNVQGKLAYVWDLSGEEHTSYDRRGRVEYVVKLLPDPVFLSISESFADAGLVSYRTAFAYDSMDRLTALTYPDNDAVGYGYNARGLLSRIHGGVEGLTRNGRVISGIDYDPSGQLAKIDYGNGVRTTYAYDPRLRLRRLNTMAPDNEATWGGGTPLIDFAYEFDGASNITAIRDQRPLRQDLPAGDKRRNTQLFNYDDLYRLTRAQYSFALPSQPDADNGSIDYRYDRIGNMTSKTSDMVHLDEKGLSVTDLGQMKSGDSAGSWNRLGRSSGDSPGPHALTSIENPKSKNANREYPYDANGNMTDIDGLACAWDYKDRLVRAENDKITAQYLYDYTDRRVMKRVFPKSVGTDSFPSASTSVLYPDKYFEVREHDAPVKYVWDGDTRVARVSGSLSPNLRTQRLRVFPGFNLISLAVTATKALQQLQEGASTESPILSAHQWDATTQDWDRVDAGETLPAGAVLWLKLAHASTLTVTGTHLEPMEQPLNPGAHFIAGWGLQPLNLSDNLIPVSSTSTWAYDNQIKDWSKRLARELKDGLNFPTMLSPGEPLFARPEVMSTLVIPEGALQIRYYHQDHMGSGSVFADANGEIVCENAYYSFGHLRTRYQDFSHFAAYSYVQKERDSESNLNYFGARYMVSWIGRFASVDAAAIDKQINPNVMNRYHYANNKPIILYDPDGNWAFLVPAVIWTLRIYSVYTTVDNVVGANHAIAPTESLTDIQKAEWRYRNEGERALNVALDKLPGPGKIAKEFSPKKKLLKASTRSIKKKSKGLTWVQAQNVKRAIKQTNKKAIEQNSNNRELTERLTDFSESKTINSNERIVDGIRGTLNGKERNKKK